MNKQKTPTLQMLTFRCQPELIEALDLVAKDSMVNRSTIIRILLVQAISEDVVKKTFLKKKGNK